MPSFGSEDPLFPETDSARVVHKKENSMATIMPASELVRRAAAWLAEQRALYPEKSLAALLDEAGMRFNLNPLDAAALGRLFDPATQEKNGKPYRAAAGARTGGMPSSPGGPAGCRASRMAAVHPRLPPRSQRPRPAYRRKCRALQSPSCASCREV